MLYIHIVYFDHIYPSSLLLSSHPHWSLSVSNSSPHSTFISFKYFSMTQRIWVVYRSKNEVLFTRVWVSLPVAYPTKENVSPSSINPYQQLNSQGVVMPCKLPMMGYWQAQLCTDFIQIISVTLRSWVHWHVMLLSLCTPGLPRFFCLLCSFCPVFRVVSWTLEEMKWVSHFF